MTKARDQKVHVYLLQDPSLCCFDCHLKIPLPLVCNLVGVLAGGAAEGAHPKRFILRFENGAVMPVVLVGLEL